MARHGEQSATLELVPIALGEALRLSLSLSPRSDGELEARRQIIIALENAMDARRQRIIVSGSTVNGVKWASLLLKATCTMVAIALVHVDNRPAAAGAMVLFATGVAISILLIASHNRPFSGDISIKPTLLLHVIRPELALVGRVGFEPELRLPPAQKWVGSLAAPTHTLESRRQ